MKMNKTFSLDVDLIHQLRKRRNQSKTICQALRIYLADDQWDRQKAMIEDLPLRTMLRAVMRHPNASKTLKAVIDAEMKQEFD